MGEEGRWGEGVATNIPNSTPETTLGKRNPNSVNRSICGAV